MIISGFCIDSIIWVLFVTSQALYVSAWCRTNFVVLIEGMVNVSCSRKKQFRTGRHRWILARFWVRFKLNRLLYMDNYALVVVSLMQRWVKTGRGSGQMMEMYCFFFFFIDKDGNNPSLFWRSLHLCPIWLIWFCFLSISLTITIICSAGHANTTFATCAKRPLGEALSIMDRRVANNTHQDSNKHSYTTKSYNSDLSSKSFHPFGSNHTVG